MALNNALHAETHTLIAETRGEGHILDLTERVQALVERSAIRVGHLTAMVTGSTAALTTTEFEPGLVEHDLVAALDRIAPADGHYEHEKTWGDDNGHSHIRASLVGPSLTLPVVDDRIPLGTWQQVILMEFDTRPRRREVVVALVGAG